VVGLLDLICDLHTSIQAALLVLLPGSARARVIAADLWLGARDGLCIQLDGWLAVAVLAIPGEVRRAPIVVKDGSGVYVAALQARAALKNFLEVVWRGFAQAASVFNSNCTGDWVSLFVITHSRRFG
jgi:hypothetical protein